MSCPTDRGFGPWAGNCRGGFDFTLLFEESVLCLSVQCIFLVGLPVRVWQLRREDGKVSRSFMKWVKIVSFVLLCD